MPPASRRHNFEILLDAVPGALDFACSLFSVLAYFTEATGIDAKYSSSENYEKQIVIDTQAGSPP
ncbi:hypothetical protein, partial [Rhizobium johnstonii]|uniref:hypothetical protein n=1 Tax=Rhizobium johnstonii TaxID=3019933 RepID=UPI003F996EC2